MSHGHAIRRDVKRGLKRATRVRADLAACDNLGGMATATKVPRIVLSDPTLFGNDAAEDERDEVFYSYAFERPELGPFVDSSRTIAIARAYKGEGKSALLRLSIREVKRGNGKRNGKPIIISKTADELAPEVSRDDYASWVRAWKASIVGVFAAEIGAEIGVAWTDDTMALVEESEKRGRRPRTLVSAILDRLKLPELSLNGAKVTVPERRVLGTVNPEEAIKRWLKEKKKLWLFVDDVDKNFANTALWRMRVAAFFDACRALCNAMPELRVRTTVRPNVWTIVKREFESLSHVEQYTVDLTWSANDARTLIAKRIEGYLRRTSQWQQVSSTLGGSQASRQEATIAFAFESPMNWGGQEKSPHIVLHTLSVHRPRWMVELAKVGATSAVRQHRSRILRDDIVRELNAFGRRRIDDTVAEFKSQCPELEELIGAFSREKEQLSTDELLKIIDNKILTHLSPTISGVSGKVSNLNVAALLFEIGLIYGRRDRTDSTYEHISFAENPTLLRSRTNVDEGLTWEVHPVFRQALDIRDAAGREQPRRHK